MEPIMTRRGGALFEFTRLPREEAIDPIAHSPLTASLVVAEYKGRVLLVFDRYRQNWEIPSGTIEPGESPRECIIRELLEESGQSVSDVNFVGVIKFGKPNGPYAFGAMYSCSLQTVSEFQPNDEIAGTEYWDFHSDIGYIDEISRYLAAELVKRQD